MDDNKLNILSQFIELGWALIPLHDVAREGSACSCGAGAYPEHSSAGKHPRNSAWQRNGWVTDVGVLASVVRDRPGWNWGAVTGRASGIWVLDVDPEHGGTESLRELLAAAGLDSGVPVTRAHATGSRGAHGVFAIGADGWMPRTGAGKIGPGLDVRAEGGQVVLPSSVSGKGAYLVVHDVLPVECPVTLRTEIERRLTPAAREPREVGPASVELQGSAGEGGDRYAAAVVEALMVETRDAPVGTRNDTAYRTGVRLWELVLAPWCSLGEADVIERWWAAAGATGAPDSELQGLWSRAYGRAVDGEPAVLPASVYGGEAVPFVGTGAAPVADVPFDPAAHRVVEVPGAVMRARKVVRSEVGRLPRPVWLIEDTLDLASDAWLIGASGSYKSFVALDWACHVATGKPWHGKRVRQGTVLYVLAEGLSGISKRLDAWESLNGTTVPDDFVILPEAVYATLDPRAKLAERASPMWRELVEMTGVDRPALIVLDTQARMTIGLNENDSSDMGFWADCVAGLKAASGACVLVVHHTGRKGPDARGSSAIDGAQDMEWTVTRDVGTGRSARLAMSKGKEVEDRVEHALAFDVVQLGEDEDGKPVTSLGVRVLAASASGAVESMADGMASEADGVVLSRRQRTALALYRLVLETWNHGEGGTRSEISVAFQQEPIMSRYKEGDSRRRTVGTAWSDLVALGIVLKADGAQRFKVAVLPSQPHGALTPNRREDAWMPPDGWSVVWPDGDCV